MMVYLHTTDDELEESRLWLLGGDASQQAGFWFKSKSALLSNDELNEVGA